MDIGRLWISYEAEHASQNEHTISPPQPFVFLSLLPFVGLRQHEICVEEAVDDSLPVTTSSSM